MKRPIVTLLIIFLSGLLAGRAHCQNSTRTQFKITIYQPNMFPRLNAPIPVLVEFDWSGRTVVTGRLRFRLNTYSSRADRLEYTTEGITLTGGIQKRMIMLPPITMEDDYGMPDCEAKFFADNGSFLGGEKFTLNVPNRTRRSLVVGIPKIGVLINNTRKIIASSLRLETYHYQKKSPDSRTMSTVLVDLPVELMPDVSIDYFPYNMILLYRNGFANMRKRQLDALRKWVWAGGSVLVVSDDVALSESHLDFLNGLLTQCPRKDIHFTLNSQSGLQISAKQQQEQGHICFNAGVGRVAVVTRTIDINKKDLEQAWWREIVAFLWFMKDKRRETLVRTGKWMAEKEFRLYYPKKDDKSNATSNRRTRANSYSRYNSEDQHGAVFDYSWHPSPLSGLDTLLAPNEVQFIPLWLIALILFSFVVMVGPVDYYVLGYFKIRRFTWVFFPMMSVLYFILFLVLADVYLGTQNYKRKLVIKDVGEDGSIVRQFEYDFLFFSKEQLYREKLKRGIYTSTDNLGGGYRRYNSSDGVRYKGDFPLNYTIKRFVRQWQPARARVVSIPKDEKCDIPWQLFKPFGLKNNQEFEKRLVKMFGSNHKVFLFGKNESYYSRNITTYNTIHANLDFVTQINNKENNFFTIVSRIAPAGGEVAEDMTLFDNQCPDEKVLVVVVKEGDDYIVYRKLYNKIQDE